MAFCEVGQHAVGHNDVTSIEDAVTCCYDCGDRKEKCLKCPRIERVLDLSVEGLCPDCAPQNAEAIQ